jgi:hypothetical protein
MYSKRDQEQKRRALACIRALIDDAAKIGVGEYRTRELATLFNRRMPHESLSVFITPLADLALQDQVAATYNWNDGALMRLNEKIKDALDPNG